MKLRSPVRKDREFSPLEKLFGSTSRARILSLLFQEPRKSFFQREVVFETGQSLQAIQRELDNLVGIGIVRRTEVGSRVYYQIDESSPLFNPLKEICRGV